MNDIYLENTYRNMNIINEIGNTPKGQEMLGRTAERAHQRAKRTSGADKQRHEKTEWDAYQTAAGNSRKHLDGSGTHFQRGRDAEYDEHWDDGRYPWSKKHESNNESRNMNKKLIRLTENDLHRIVKASVKRIVKENLYRNKNGKLIWEPAEETKYSIGPEGPNGWPNLLNKDDRSETGYQIYGWEELPDDKRRYSVWNSIARNSEDFIPEQKMHKIVKESVSKILNEVNFNGKSFHGNNPSDWMELSNMREKNAWNASDGKESYDSYDEMKPEVRKNFRASERDEDNAFEIAAQRRAKNRELDIQGKVYVDKFVKLRPRVYRYNDLYKSQANKVFNGGMGSLAFVNFLVDEKTILVNKVLANKKDIELLNTNFPEWQIEFVSLGYPDWYEIKNLKSCRGK